MAYRSDVDALEARLASLDDQLGDTKRERDEVVALLEEARGKQREVERPVRRAQRRNLALIIGVVLAIVGVVYLASRSKRSTRIDTEQAIERMKAFGAEMCACRDPVCAQRVSDSMLAWSQAMARDVKEPPKMSESQMRQLTEIGQALGECMRTAMTADSKSAL